VCVCVSVCVSVCVCVCVCARVRVCARLNLYQRCNIRARNSAHQWDALLDSPTATARVHCLSLWPRGLTPSNIRVGTPGVVRVRWCTSRSVGCTRARCGHDASPAAVGRRSSCNGARAARDGSPVIDAELSPNIEMAFVESTAGGPPPPPPHTHTQNSVFSKHIYVSTDMVAT
jgi:hypothetical protein